MNRRLTLIAILTSLSALGAAPTSSPRGATQPTAAQQLIVHEWGTFTSVAGKDGQAVEWCPLNGPVDLPGFVQRLRFNIKGRLAARIRMETPVLYFYTPQEITADVRVRFRQGVVTEWFPRAAVTPANVDGFTLRRPDLSGSIAWSGVRVSPGATEDALPEDGSANHYYRARQTDASPLRVGLDSEKFLFYRGLGNFEPPLAATVGADGRVVVRPTRGEPLGDVILFDNAGGMMSYQVRHADGGQLVFGPRESAGEGSEEIAPPLGELEQILIARGLFPKEARAMLNTWRDSWFKEGTRLFYIVPAKMIESILPLDINPKPTGIVRVFVGRVELVRRL